MSSRAFYVVACQRAAGIFTYRLPAGITPDTYRLLFQRQSGTQPLPLSLTLTART